MTRAAAVAEILLALLGVVSCNSPSEPSDSERSLTGTWRGTASRAPCGEGWSEEWSIVEMTLVQEDDAVSGEVFAPGGRRFPISSVDATWLVVGGLEGSSTCSEFALRITDRTIDARGELERFSGTLEGRCCGTVAGSFSFERT